MIRSFAVLLLVLGIVSRQASAQDNSTPGWKKDREEAVDMSEITIVTKKEPEKRNLPKWGVGVNGGYGYRLFRAGHITSRHQQDYIKDAKAGIAFGGDIAFFPWKHVGFGARYEMYRSDAKMDSSLREQVAIQHLSGALIHRGFLKNGKTAVLTSLLVGYQPYENKSTVGAQQLAFSGKTMNWGVSVGIEQPLSAKFALNITGAATMGAIYRLQRKTGLSTETLHLSKDESVDLSRVSLTLGIRFL